MEYYNRDLYVIPRCVFSLTERAKRWRGTEAIRLHVVLSLNLGQLRNEYAAKFFTKSHNPKNYRRSSSSQFGRVFLCALFGLTKLNKIYGALIHRQFFLMKDLIDLTTPHCVVSQKTWSKVEI